MRSIAVINQKGGVGKTTTAVNVAAGLARRGRRVLLIDIDAQAHATQHVGIDSTDIITVYDVLLNGAPLLDAMRTVGENLTLVPSHIDLVATDIELRDRQDRETVLLDALQASRDHFDVCVMDCPPSLGLITINALAAAEEVIIPLQPHFLALQGLGRLLETVSLVRGVIKPELRVSGIVLCMYESATRLAREVRDDVSQFVRSAEYQDAWYGARVFDTVIRKNIKLAECPAFGQTIFEYAPESHGAVDYEALVAEIDAMADAGGEPEQIAARSSVGDVNVENQSIETGETAADADEADESSPPASIPIAEIGRIAPPIENERSAPLSADCPRDAAAS